VRTEVDDGGGERKLPTCSEHYLYHEVLSPNHVDFAIAIVGGLKIEPAITMACCLGWDNVLLRTVATVPVFSC